MTRLLTIPNILSLLRIPLTFLFIQGTEGIRIVAVVIAGLTDALDGFLARKYGLTSRIGTLLDPLTDKMFVLTALGVLFFENKITLFELGTMLSRDIAVLLFGIYLFTKGMFGQYRVEAIWCGKLFTALQLFALLALILSIPLPVWFFWTFVLLGVLSLVELGYSLKKLVY